MNDLLQPGRHLLDRNHGAHPDSDQLSAFAERALPAHEQQQTLAHLAVCADCRALVYLAQAAEPVESPLPQAQPARSPWFASWNRWNLAWPAMVALGCLVLATIHLRQTATPPSAVPAPATAAVDQTQAPIVPLRAESTYQAGVAHTPPPKKPQPTGVALTPANAIRDGAVSADAVDQFQVAIPAPPLPAAAPSALFGSRALSASISGEGEISGIVTDPTGAVIAHARVTATNTETGVQTTRESTPKGDYTISPLSPGNYNVEATATGFQRLLQENVQVSPTQVAGLNMKLKVGSENTTVTITDAPPFLDTANATLGGTIESELYTNLPLTASAGPRDPTQFQYRMPEIQEGPQPNSAGGQTQGIYGGSGQQNLNENYIEGMAVTNITAQGDNSPVSKAMTTGAGAGGSSAALARQVKPLPQLPSHRPAISTAENGRQTLALDSAGALFRSDDAGVTWHPVSAQWQGHAKALRYPGALAATLEVQAAAAADALSDDAAPPSAATRPVTESKAAPPLFELTTDSGAVYTSPDGQRWTRK